MQELHSLIHCLTCSEWQALQGYFTCFTEHDPAKLKYAQLAKMLMDAEECPADVSCCLKIYGVKSDSNFEKLKSRLREKILDFLLTDISADKQKELDEADYAIIKMKKKSAQFQQLFYSKKRMPLLYGLLDEIIVQAKKYEQYSILVDHLRLKKALAGLKIGREEFEKIDVAMQTALLCLSLANKAEHFYYKLIISGDFSGKQDKQKTLQALKQNIAEVQAGFELTNSPMIHYYLKNLEMGYYQLQEDYLRARSVCLELSNIVRNNKSVRRKQRLAVVYDNLSRCEFYLGNFEEAATCARDAQIYFNQGSENYCIALEQEFYALFALKQYRQSSDIATKMITSAARKELGEFRHSKYHYLLANTFFMQRDFEGALGILSEKREISTDKAGWETGARILTIMTLIEMLKLDEASLAIYGLKQFFKRTDKKTLVSKRDKTILNLLLILERAGFRFGSLNGSTEKHLITLGSPEEETRWEPFTSELIPFHKWMSGKMGGRTKTHGDGKEKAPILVPSKSKAAAEKFLSR
ncbi:MAG: hypothetical protein EPN85_05545 [Bacteroidetes bacterium]|nr:MAG: hypothetical protein EPN85_05545 [Bacteroidota bacterium]